MPVRDQVLLALCLQVLLLAAIVAVYLFTDGATQRRWIPRLIVGGAIYFVAAAFGISGDPRALYIAGPIVAVVAVANLYMTVYCSRCGTAHMPFGVVRLARKCRGCDAALP